MGDDSNDKIDTEAFRGVGRLLELRVAHRDLDRLIADLTRDPSADELLVRRLKIRKLRLKDLIAKLGSQLIPDLNA